MHHCHKVILITRYPFIREVGVNSPESGSNLCCTYRGQISRADTALEVRSSGWSTVTTSPCCHPTLYQVSVYMKNKAIIVLLHHRLFKANFAFKEENMALCRWSTNLHLYYCWNKAPLVIFFFKSYFDRFCCLLPYCMCSKLAQHWLNLMSDIICIECIFNLGCVCLAHNWEVAWVHIGFLIQWLHTCYGFEYLFVLHDWEIQELLHGIRVFYIYWMYINVTVMSKLHFHNVNARAF